MEQSGQHIFVFLQHYGYFMMLPLMIIEGPVATIISAMLASLGAFNVFLVFLLSVSGDVIGDVFLFGLGRRYGIDFVNRVGKYIGITEKLVRKMEKYFIRHGGKTIFAVKSTTGLCWATFVAAGISKMEFWKFFKYSLLGGLIWSSFLVAMGYFYGYLWREISVYIKWIGWIIFGVAVATIILFNLYKAKQGRSLLKKNGESEA